MMRCLKCGCSRFDSKGVGCARCGGALGPRRERCYISENTKAVLVAHSEELKEFGITLEEHEPLGKSADTVIGIAGLALAAAESLREGGTLHKLIVFLRDRAIPEEEILRLRLDEPEQILTYYRMDKTDSEVALKR